MLIVLTGGARSGKSRLAVDWAQRRVTAGEPGPGVAFVATCPRIDGDTDLEARIGAHRAERPTGWVTIEAEHDLVEAVVTAGDDPLVIVDCLTLWVANLLFRGGGEEEVLTATESTLAVIGRRRGDTVVVTNEVGLGIVPADVETRAYRDVLGRVNQSFVAAADHALFLAAGRAVPLASPEELLP